MKEHRDSIPAKIAELKMLIANKERDLKASKETDEKLTKELEDRKEKVMQLRATEKHLTGEHQKAKDEFESNTKNRGPTEQDAVKGLLAEDPRRFNTLMTDLVMTGGKSAEPNWAHLDFLPHESGGH